MAYQFGVSLAKSAQSAKLNGDQARVLCNWLLNFHNGKSCPVYRLASSIMVDQPIDAILALSAIEALEKQHTGTWAGSRQLVIANALAGLMCGVDPATVFGRTCEFISAYECRLAN